MQHFRSTPADIHAAADLLRTGGVVAFPTETVYGLGADASNESAVQRIFAIKGRPADHPLILHVASPWALQSWVAAVPPSVWMLAGRFWPGPLTLVLKRSDAVPDAVTGGQDTVAIRIPDHPAALALLNAFGGALAAPSANLYGRTSPTSAEHVVHQLHDRLDGLLDGGACHVGIESTILDLSSDRACILRQGSITADMLAPSLGYVPEVVAIAEVRTPGSDKSHYAPRAPLYLADAARIRELANECRGPVHVLTCGSEDLHSPAAVVHRMTDNPDQYARLLYATLHAADQQGAGSILVEMPPDQPGWGAVRDRLTRAAGSDYPRVLKNDTASTIVLAW